MRTRVWEGFERRGSRRRESGIEERRVSPLPSGKGRPFTRIPRSTAFAHRSAMSSPRASASGVRPVRVHVKYTRQGRRPHPCAAQAQRRVRGSIGLIALLVCGGSYADPISEQKTSQHTYPVSSATPRLFVRNIWGNVTVRAGDAREITVTVHEHRMAPTQELLERSKEQIRLNEEMSSDGVSLIVGNPDRRDGRTDMCRGCRVDYQFEISAPPDTQIDVGTVTDGRVEIAGIRGLVNASNVNGSVAATDLSNCAKIHSVNGALDVQFARAPGEDCTLETINGRITVGLPTGTGLNAILSVNHGDIESDFDVEPMTLPTKLEKQDNDDRYSYRIVQPAGVRLGAGGPTFTFASLNGDVRIRKNK
jgi:hypothetical protein